MMQFESLEQRRLLSGAFPTAYEQYVLQLINRARANPGAEVTRLSGSTWGDDPTLVPGTAYPAPQTPSLNEGLPAGTIVDTPEPPLAFNADLTLTSEDYSQTLLSDESPITHTLNGTTPTSRAQANGYAGQAGENLAIVANSAAMPVSAAVAEQLHDNLFVDNNVTGRGHRLNLLNTTSGYREVGIGLAASSDYTAFGSATPNAVLLTEDFGVPADNNPILTGVAFADANNNHFYDPGEGLGNVTITATRTSDNAVFSTTTWTAGGYSLQLAPGTYSVTASGNGISTPSPIVVTLSTQNVEEDFTPGAVATTAPTVVTQPAPQTVSAGSNVTFSAAVSGTPTPTVKWQVSSNGGAFTNIPGANSTTLSFIAQNSENGDEYRAVFTNADGVATTNPAQLTVAAVSSGTPLFTTALTGVLPSQAVSGAPTAAKQTLVVTNNSLSAINQFATVQLFLSPDPTLDSSAIPVGLPRREHVKIGADGQQDFSLPLRKFPSAGAGNYFVLARLSSSGATALAASNAEISLASPLVNLSDSVTVVSTTVKPGKKAVIAITVANSGNVRAKGRLQIALSASTDPAGANSQILRLASAPIAIAPGAKAVLRLTVPLPAAMVPGAYFITAGIDPNNAFAESNPNDNTATSSDTFNVI
jgi:serralysin